MRTTERTLVHVVLVTCGLLSAAVAAAQPLTVDRAVEMALKRSTAMVNAEADVLSARGSLYGAYSGILPSVSASVSRSGSWTEKSRGVQIFGSTLFPIARNDRENFSTDPGVNASWDVLNLSSLAHWRAAQNTMRSAKSSHAAARNDVVLATKRQFYEVVKAVKLADVAAGALRLAHDDERRVTALFEVGSVSRSDLLKARVRTAQSELDSLTANQSVTVQRILLAEQLGILESELGEVDTVLVAEAGAYDEQQVLAEAAANRPDLAAADASVKAAEGSLRSANLRRLPFLSVQGGLSYRPKSSFKSTAFDTINRVTNEAVPLDDPIVTTGSSRSDLSYNASIALGINIFSGFATEGAIANARAGVMRARESRDALRRNLASEVHQAILTHRQAVESDRVAQRALESATESLKLTQQKYNVGSATILDLIDAQVQLQRAQSDGVSARAGIRVAEAQIERVRGGRR